VERARGEKSCDGKSVAGRERMIGKEIDNCRIIMEWQVGQYSEETTKWDILTIYLHKIYSYSEPHH
jgi:hypothetical protein